MRGRGRKERGRSWHAIFHSNRVCHSFVLLLHNHRRPWNVRVEGEKLPALHDDDDDDPGEATRKCACVCELRGLWKNFPSNIDCCYVYESSSSSWSWIGGLFCLLHGGRSREDAHAPVDNGGKVKCMVDPILPLWPSWERERERERERIERRQRQQQRSGIMGIGRNCFHNEALPPITFHERVHNARCCQNPKLTPQQPPRRQLRHCSRNRTHNCAQ